MPNNEKKTRFNMIDFIIIVVILAGIIVTVFRGAILDRLSFGVSSDSARITFYAENLTAGEVASLAEKDEFSLSDKTLGTLKSFNSQAQKVNVLSSDGKTFVRAEDENLYTVIGEMEISGENTENGFFFDSDVYIGVGKVLNIESKKCDISIVITKITENEG